jgi:cell division septation protein DedD
MLVFSGVFFTLGYVMGRSQYDGQVRAAGTSFGSAARGVQPKSEPAAKGNTKLPSDSSPDVPSQPDSDWTYYKAAKSNAPEENLKPVSSAPPSRPVSPTKGRNTKSPAAVSGAGYTLQVAALRREPDALTLAAHLQKKKFPAFVASPHGDKYYRVLVGPYADQKSADAARKGLEGAGFKAIVKH